jgi:hypothetical protein
MEKLRELDIPDYFIYGTSEQGKVDIATCNNETIVTCTKEQAEYLIKDRNEVIKMIEALGYALMSVDEKLFAKIWYTEGRLNG